MTARYFLGLDWGSGGGRAVLMNVATGHARSARRAWRTEAVPGTNGLGWTLDAQAALAALGEATREVVLATGADAAEVAGIAVTALRFGQVLVGADGSVIEVAASRDAQAVGESLRLGADAPRIQEVTGHWPLPILTGPRLQRWGNVGALAPGVRTVALSDWVAFALCGELATDHTQASASGVFDVRERSWARDASTYSHRNLRNAPLHRFGGAAGVPRAVLISLCCRSLPPTAGASTATY